MKKQIVVLFAVMVLACTGCTKTAYENGESAPKTMTVVDGTAGYTIYRHDPTGVHYFCRDAGSCKSVCVMLNPDGTPYTGAEVLE
jgi:hypothetical protein